MSASDLMALVARAGPTEARFEDAYLPDRPIVLHAARPVAFSPRTPILFVHHGDLRNGAELRDFWLPLVDRFDVLAVVPEFSEAKFPGSGWYSLGNRSDGDGRNKPREQWTYGVPARIFTALSHCGVTARAVYGQFGHSSGAQFVHRSICLGFRDAVTAAVTANAGTYSMPDLNVAFPYGLGGTDIDSSAMRDLLGFPLAIFAGTADIDVTSPHFPKDEPAMRQGLTRFARAHTYLATAREAATRHGVHCAWSLTEVAGVGHEADKMSAAAAAYLAAALHRSAWR